MVRIGKQVTFTGSREKITDKILFAIDKQPPTEPINWSFINDNMMNIYGDNQDLNALKTFLESKGFSFTVGPNAPAEPTDPGEPAPTQDELDAIEFFKQAFNAEMAALETAILASIETRYNALKGANPIAFADVPKSGIKHLRQRI